jgi:hypothetical protein
VGADAEALIFRLVLQAGEHDPDENEWLTPAGKPDAEKEIGCDAPLTRVAAITE